MNTMKVYEVFVNGQKVGDRKTLRDYTHAIVLKDANGRMIDKSYCGRGDLAQKAAADYQARMNDDRLRIWNGTESVKIVEVLIAPVTLKEKKTALASLPPAQQTVDKVLALEAKLAHHDEAAAHDDKCRQSQIADLRREVEEQRAVRAALKAQNAELLAALKRLVNQPGIVDRNLGFNDFGEALEEAAAAIAKAE